MANLNIFSCSVPLFSLKKKFITHLSVTFEESNLVGPLKIFINFFHLKFIGFFLPKFQIGKIRG